MEVTVVNSTAVAVSWFAVELMHDPGLHYKLHYEVSSSQYYRDFTLDVGGDQTVVDIELLTVAGLEHQFSVAAVYEVEGVEFEGEKSDVATLVYGEFPSCEHYCRFNIMYTPQMLGTFSCDSPQWKTVSPGQ